MKQNRWTATELAEEIKAGRYSCTEAVREVLHEIEKKEDLLHAFLLVDRNKALKRAEYVDREIAAGRLNSTLAGVPIAVKDNICTAGIKTTCASRMLENFVPSYTATAVERLEAAGAVVIGKTNMDEFAMGSTTETSAFGASKNPYCLSCTPGGSSGGSAVAVAAGEAYLALGSDTGGSIRQPAAFCGIYGLKPTYGSVSRYGLIAYASSLDQIGPMGRSVKDCAAALEIMAGKDTRDAGTLMRGDGKLLEALERKAEGLRIGIPKEYLEGELDEEIRQALYAQVECLNRMGARTEEFELKLPEYVVLCYYTIASAEASSNLARFDGVKYGFRSENPQNLHELYQRSRAEGFGTEVKRRIMLGNYVLSAGYYRAYYEKALRVKAKIKMCFDRAFASYDVLMTPVTLSGAPALGTYSKEIQSALRLYQEDLYTVPVNLAGLPAISVPSGLNKNGMPVGVQLIGNCFEEKKILRCAYALEYEKSLGKKGKE